ncbi:MAG: VWA domain-containing protein [Arenicellales bacterium]|nr:VWA domain-containing protein [Arenicellales bacterium]
MKRRRDISVFGLSFLDVMFCGFGSIILLVMIINSETLAQRKVVHQDLRGEVKRLETEVKTGQDYLVEVRNTLELTSQQETAARGRTREVLHQINQAQQELATLDKKAQAQKEHINRLKSDLKRTEADRQKLASEQEQAEKQSRNVRKFIGEGDRQYLTGLKMGGERILILVDASASMLDETIVNIVRLRNLPEGTKRQARKWQRAVQTVEWLLSQLPTDSKFQVNVFNTESYPVVSRSEWLQPKRNSLDEVVAGINQVVPEGGTSLYNAFDKIKGLKSKPDNVILLTDGLPTQGKTRHRSGRVSGKQRLNYFRQALKRLPRNVPINTILFPIEGDPLAASEYWKLAVSSGGSFMSPSRDWP